MIDLPSTRRTDRATRTILASRDRIYRAFLDPRAWEKWIPPAGMTGQVYAFEPRPGGAYRMALTYGAENASGRGKTTSDTDIVEGRFLELKSDERVVQLVTFKSDDPALAGEMIMTWRLSPTAGGTEVSIVCENVPNGISEADHAAGLNSTLENLALFCE